VWPRRIAGGADMPLFGMCAISERPAGAGPSDRNGQSRWPLNGAGGRGHYCHAVLAPPHFTSHTSQEARCMRHPPDCEIKGVLGRVPSNLMHRTGFRQRRASYAIRQVAPRS
jgi:hypothetical protein